MTGSRIQFNRHELSGAFGDADTDLPLITGIILSSGMNPAAVLGVFGFPQVAALPSCDKRNAAGQRIALDRVRLVREPLYAALQTDIPLRVDVPPQNRRKSL